MLVSTGIVNVIIVITIVVVVNRLGVTSNVTTYPNPLLCLPGDLNWARVSTDNDGTRSNDIDNNTTELHWTEGATSDLDLNAYLQMNDIIEYRSSPDEIPRRGKITSIGSMKDDMILKLNNGSWLSRSEHQVKRLEVARDMGSDDLFVNPNPQWRHLSDIFVIPPFENVHSDEEDDTPDDDNDDQDGDDGHDNSMDNVNDSDNDSEFEFNIFGLDNDQNDTEMREADHGREKENGEANRQRSKKNSKQRTADGRTTNDIRTRDKRAKKENKKLNQRRRTDQYLKWATNSAEYAKAKKKVNDLYASAISYGILDIFHDIKIYEAREKSEFNKLVSEFRRRLRYRVNNNYVKLPISGSVTFMDNPSSGIRSASNETNRARMIFEESMQFEYTMKTLQLRTCDVCRTNKLEFKKKDIDRDRECGGYLAKKTFHKMRRDNTRVDDSDSNTDGEGDNSAVSNQVTTDDKFDQANFICASCIKNKYHQNDHYLESNLHPVWYERDINGEIRIDSEGRSVARYDIPPELKLLTMAEKLLIRRCSPMIPSHHLKHGFYGIEGHCICFPQHIEAMCSELPQQKSNMVIFVRHISTRLTGEVRSRHFRVNKARVIRALEWLKIHHIGYHDITINESNMDWIVGDSIYSACAKCEIEMHPSRLDKVNETSETVAAFQTDVQRDALDDTNSSEPDQIEEVNTETVHPNIKLNRPNPEQTEMMKELQQSAANTGNRHKVLEFPPIDHTNPLK